MTASAAPDWQNNRVDHASPRITRIPSPAMHTDAFTLLVGSIMLCAACCSGASAPHHGYVLQGVLSISDLRPAHTGTPDWQHRFRIQAEIDRDTWCIEDLTWSPRAAFTQGELIVSRTDVGNGSVPSVAVSTYWRGYPIDLDLEFRQLWTSFCSRAYLRRRDADWLPIPYGDLRLDLFPLATRASCRWRTGGDVSPSEILFTMDHGFLEAATTHLLLQAPSDYLEQRDMEMRLIKQHIPQGAVVAEFRVREWRMVADHGIPAQWVLRVNGMNGVPHTQVAWATEDAREIESVLMPAFPSPCMAVDKRVRDVRRGVNYVVYPLTNSIIPDARSPQVTHLTERAVSSDVFTMPPNLRLTRWMCLTMLAIVFFLPGALLLAKSRGEGSRKHSREDTQ